MHRDATRAFLAVSAILALVAGACGRTFPQADGHRLEKIEPAARHALNDARLRVIMGQLDFFMDERLPQEMDVQAARERQFGHLAAAAERMVRSTEEITSVIDGLDLSAEGEKVFTSLVAELRGQAIELQAAASQRAEPARIDQLFGKITRTCEDCHNLFRPNP